MAAIRWLRPAGLIRVSRRHIVTHNRVVKRIDAVLANVVAVLQLTYRTVRFGDSERLECQVEEFVDRLRNTGFFSAVTAFSYQVFDPEVEAGEVAVSYVADPIGVDIKACEVEIGV